MREKREGGRIGDDEVAEGRWRNREDDEDTGIKTNHGNPNFHSIILPFVCYKIPFYRNKRREVSARRRIAAIMRLFVDRSVPLILRFW